MKPIGGFFELEHGGTKKNTWHKDALALSTGRACFNLILQKTNPKKIYVPYYTCDAVLDPVLQNKTPFAFYSINEKLEISKKPELKKGEYILYINYFGIKNNYVKKLLAIYDRYLIVDNSQAFFEKKYPVQYSFNSARKWFGVPDGAYLYTPEKTSIQLPVNEKISIDHLVSRAKKKYALAYKQFTAYEESIDCSVTQISPFSQNILHRINYRSVSKKRKQNFATLHRHFKKKNRLNLNLSASGTPFCYPLLIDKITRKKSLSEKGLFIPVYWKEVVTRKRKNFHVEKKLAKNLLLLPVDHRYSKSDMELMIKKINQYL